MCKCNQGFKFPKFKVTIQLKKDQKFADNMKFFHFGEVKVGAFKGKVHGKYFSSLKNVSDGGSLHNSHFHSGEFNISKIIIK